MANFYEIPLNPGNQKFNVMLNKTLYKLQLIYRIDRFYLDIFDTSENAIILGLSVQVGVNMLEQHQHLISGSLFAYNSNADESQVFSELGTKIKLYWRNP